mgnify:CR=1 FL=1|jgi:hypothetical protein
MTDGVTTAFTGISPYGVLFSTLTRDLVRQDTTPFLLANAARSRSEREIIGSTAMGILLNQAADEIGNPLVEAFGGIAKAGNWLTQREPGQEYPLVMLAKGKSVAVMAAAQNHHKVA